MRTLGSLYAALLLQGSATDLPAGSENGMSVVELIANSTPVAKAVLVILALFSIASWSVILYKWWVFGRAQRQSATFLDVFRRSSKFSEVQAVCRSLSDSPSKPEVPKHSSCRRFVPCLPQPPEISLLLNPRAGPAL